MRWPNANIGIRTGADSGFDVLDIDPHHGGDDSFDQLVAKAGGSPATIEQLTGVGHTVVQEAARASRNPPATDHRQVHPIQRDGHQQAKRTRIACQTYTRLTKRCPYPH
jgi:hypothetical protein